MAKRKLQRFEEITTFPNVLQPTIEDALFKDYWVKNKWNSDFFKNENPIIVELGCGKGEYSVGLAERFPENNYIGVDIKGARMWRGSKTAIEKNLKNVGFLRTRIDLIRSFFGEGEVSEIWITFPDPQPYRIRRRLSSAKFLNLYKPFLRKDGIVHLKTDSSFLYEYTLEIVKYNNLEIFCATNDLYHSDIVDPILAIRTYYESQFLAQNKTIKYLKFSLSKVDEIRDFT